MSPRPKTEPLFVADLLDLEEKSKASLDSPTFFNANFVVKLANILTDSLECYHGYNKKFKWKKKIVSQL
jgi:hypothetical protein